MTTSTGQQQIDGTAVHYETAAAILIATCGRLLFQQRDNIQGILYPGMVGLFGGHRESGESFVQCVRRELLEEIGYAVPAEALKPLVRSHTSYPDGRSVLSEYFLVSQVPAEQLVISEGALLVVEHSELPGLLSRMTPLACLAAKVYMQQQS